MEISDILGTKPIAEAANTTVAKTFDGIEGFLKSVCVPALEEVGLMIKDQFRYWRLKNILKILEKAKGKLNYENEQLQVKADPRVALAIIENGSLIDNDEVQELWAGLFASSCTDSGKDDENLIFVDLLKQLTVPEARIIKYACENSRKAIHSNQLITSEQLIIDRESLIQISGILDIYRLDRELDHLCSLSLITFGGGFSLEDGELTADISPTTLALNLFVRSQGVNKSLGEFWEKSLIPYIQIQMEEEEKERQEIQQRIDKAKKDAENGGKQ